MEQEFLDWLREHVPADPRVPLGLNDDAALLQLAQAQHGCIVTSDMVMDGIDFHLELVGAERAGRKALAVNLSDLAAMAARPLAAIISIAVPRGQGAALAQQLYEGLLPLARQFDIAIAGGDTNSWDGPLVLNVMALGEVTERGPLLRSGARPGDAILVTGSFGGSLSGKHLDFQPRVKEALHLHEHYNLHAGMDVSDGLSLDLSRMASASGCGAALRLESIPIAPAAYALAEDDPHLSSPLQRALGDGEDFELILALPPDQADAVLRDQPLDEPLTCIGRFVEQPGLWQENSQGQLESLAARGYQH